MDRNYGGVIWTNHALDRLKERGISQGDAFAAFNHPDKSTISKKSGGYVYYKNLGSQKIEVVAKKNEEGKWLILSVWSGTGKENKKTSFLGKIFSKLFS